jgi:hypothetical protein
MALLTLLGFTVQRPAWHSETAEAERHAAGDEVQSNVPPAFVRRFLIKFHLQNTLNPYRLLKVVYGATYPTHSGGSCRPRLPAAVSIFFQETEGDRIPYWIYIYTHSHTYIYIYIYIYNKRIRVQEYKDNHKKKNEKPKTRTTKLETI